MLMNPGRELDALVAEKVMGWRHWESSYAVGPKPHWITPDGDSRVEWSPSTDIAAAWEVVDKLGSGAMWMQRMSHTGLTSDSTEPELVEYTKAHGRHPNWRVKFGKKGKWAFSDSSPHAICLAALKAIGQ